METPKEKSKEEIASSTRSKIKKEIESGHWSPKFCAILGCMLKDKWTNPYYEELCITSDGFLMGRELGDIGFNDFIGNRSQLNANLVIIATSASLDRDEMDYLFSLPNIRQW